MLIGDQKEVTSICQLVEIDEEPGATAA